MLHLSFCLSCTVITTSPTRLFTRSIRRSVPLPPAVTQKCLSSCWRCVSVRGLQSHWGLSSSRISGFRGFHSLRRPLFLLKLDSTRCGDFISGKKCVTKWKSVQTQGSKKYSVICNEQVILHEKLIEENSKLRLGSTLVRLEILNLSVQGEKKNSGSLYSDISRRNNTHILWLLYVPKVSCLYSEAAMWPTSMAVTHIESVCAGRTGMRFRMRFERLCVFVFRTKMEDAGGKSIS